MVSAYFRRMKLQIPSGSDDFFIVGADDCNFNFFLGGKEEGERVDSDYVSRAAGGKGAKVTVVAITELHVGSTGDLAPNKWLK